MVLKGAPEVAQGGRGERDQKVVAQSAMGLTHLQAQVLELCQGGAYDLINFFII